MSPSSSSSLVSPPRDPFIDFWRGAYLLMIYVNHVPDNLLSFLTLRNWGFADSAEAFVFLSGFSAILAFRKYFDQGGFGVGVLRVGRRVWQLFCAHVLLVFAMSAVIAIAGHFIDSKTIMEELNFSPFFVETDVAIVRLLKLGYMPNMTDILPLYIVLVALFPIIWLLLKAGAFWVLGASFLVWLWVNLTGLSLANYPEGAVWFFNPLAWQILFVAGIVACAHKEQALRLARSKIILALSCAILFVSFLAVAPWTHVPAWKDLRLIPAEYLAWDQKNTLSWVRVIHFFALAVVAVWITPRRQAFWEHLAVRAVSFCGRHALAVYATGSVVSLVVHIFLTAHAMKLGESILVVAGGGLLLVGLAWVLEYGKDKLRKVEKMKNLAVQTS